MVDDRDGGQIASSIHATPDVYRHAASVSILLDRPPIGEVRRILRERKETIDRKVASG